MVLIASFVVQRPVSSSVVGGRPTSSVQILFGSYKPKDNSFTSLSSLGRRSIIQARIGYRMLRKFTRSCFSCSESPILNRRS